MEPAQLPFPTMRFAEGRYQVLGVVTHRRAPGEEVIHRQRERCGKSEAVHSVMKSDLAWWAIVGLAFNLNALMTHLVLPEGWAHKRLKALRFARIGVAGRVLGPARRLIVPLTAGHPASALLIEVRSRMRGLAPLPPGEWGPTSTRGAVRGRLNSKLRGRVWPAFVGCRPERAVFPHQEGSSHTPASAT